MKTKFLMLVCLLGIQQLTAQNDKPVNQKAMSEFFKPNKSVPVVFIDTFTVPDNAKTDFLERVKINRDLLKTLPGFIEDHAYEKTAGDGSFNYVTIAIWENEEAIENAKQQVMASYKKSGLDMPKFLKKNNITLQRATYKEIEN